MSKDLGIKNIKEAKDKIPDLKVFGDGDTWVLLCKASSEAQGWMKSTKVMNVFGGCVVQVSTQQGDFQKFDRQIPDGSYSIAEAITFVPGVHIDKTVNPPRLVPEFQLKHKHVAGEKR